MKPVFWLLCIKINKACAFIHFFKKASEYIEAYRILDLHHPVLSTKAVYNSCAESGDDLIIFTN